MSLSKAITAWTYAALFGLVGASLAPSLAVASCGTRAIVLPPGMRGEIVQILLAQHREEVKEELVRSGLPASTPVPCFACRENVPLPPVPVPPSPTVFQRSQLIDALLLPLISPQFDAARGLLRDHSSVLDLLLDSPPPTPPPIA